MAAADRCEEGGVVTADQIRAARGLLNWTQQELAERAGLTLRECQRKRLQAMIASPSDDCLTRPLDVSEASGDEKLATIKE